MEVRAEISIEMLRTGVAKLHFRSDTEETYIEVDGTNVRETNPTINAYRSFVVGLVQSLMKERNRFFQLTKELERNGTD